MSISEYPDELQVTAEGPLRIVRLNRPDRKNAINEAMHTALTKVWRDLADDPDARVVLLFGNGPLFTAGGDFSWFRELIADDNLTAKAFAEGQRIIDDMAKFSLPVVAGIRGAAVGLGASLGVLSDIVVMSDDGFYRDSHVPVGLVAGDGGVAAWPTSMPLQMAKEYLMLGDRLPAQTAQRIGLVNRVVPSEQVEDEARAIAERLAAMPPAAVQYTKRALNLHLQRGLHGAAEFGLAAELLTHRLPDFRSKFTDYSAESSGKGDPS